MATESVAIDDAALAMTLAAERARNGERYGFFKWAEGAFANLRVVPPGQGICHQINLEQLARIAVPGPGHPLLGP